MTEPFDIALISDRTGIAARKLRYVLDHGLVGDGPSKSRGRGLPRLFTPLEAFAIAAAALMLESGIRQAIVRGCLELLSRRPPRSAKRETDSIPLCRAYEAAEAAWLEVGDGGNVRLQGRGTGPHRKAFDTGWRQIETGAVIAAGYEPDVSIRFNVRKLKRRLGGELV